MGGEKPDYTDVYRRWLQEEIVEAKANNWQDAIAESKKTKDFVRMPRLLSSARSAEDNVRRAEKQYDVSLQHRIEEVPSEADPSNSHSRLYIKVVQV